MEAGPGENSHAFRMRRNVSQGLCSGIRAAAAPLAGTTGAKSGGRGPATASTAWDAAGPQAPFWYDRNWEKNKYNSTNTRMVAEYDKLHMLPILRFEAHGPPQQVRKMRRQHARALHRRRADLDNCRTVWAPLSKASFETERH